MEDVTLAIIAAILVGVLFIGAFGCMVYDMHKLKEQTKAGQLCCEEKGMVLDDFQKSANPQQIEVTCKPGVIINWREN